MSGNKNSGRKPKPNGVRTSILIDAPTLVALRFMATKEQRTNSAVIQSALEEYFLAHFEKELEREAHASNNQS